MIRAVVFDMFETLVSLFTGRTYFSENIREDLQNVGVSLDEFRGAWHATEVDRSVGKYTMAEGLAKTLRLIGYGGTKGPDGRTPDGEKPWDEEKIAEAVKLVTRKRREALGDTFANIPEASVKLLKDLHENGFKVGLISNCFSDECEMIKGSVLFPYFDVTRMSYECGIIKPNRAVFESICEELGVTPQECLYVGDGGSKELFAARAMGMTAVQALWFRPGMFEPHVPSPVYREFAHMETQADVLTEALRIDYEITDSITPEEYMEMRRLVGWSEFPLEQAAEGLKNSSYLCCFRRDGKPIAMTRVIWDHGYVVYLADVIVRPDCQAKGLGRDLMNRVMAFINGTVLKPGYRVMVSLQAAKGKEEFYERFGFAPRPTEEHGCGMHQWLEAGR